VRPSIQHLLGGLTGAAAFVHNARLDNLAANQLGHALYADMFSRAAGLVPSTAPATSSSTRRPRLLRRLGPRRQRRRRRAALSSRPRPYDRDLSDLVGELSTQRTEFRTRWAAHNVRFHDTGSKDFHHPVVGDLTLTYNRMELAADPGQMLMIWTAEPGSTSAEALRFLGSWATTPHQPELQDTPDHPKALGRPHDA
jgi:hypothetical protein